MADLRAIDMHRRYMAGDTLEVIGQSYCLTRERVRQIIKPFGDLGNAGGKSVSSRQNKERAKAEHDAKANKRMAEWLPLFGCLYAEVVRLNEGNTPWARKGPAKLYIQHFRAAAFRNIPWEFTFPQ